MISNRFITAKLPSTALRASSTPPVCTILAYKDNTLALLAKFGPMVGDYLIVLDVSPGDVAQRCLLCERLRSTNKLFCVVDDGHLYYGTQSASSGQGYPEWLILGFCLTGPSSSAISYCRKPTTEAPLQLDGLSGLDPFSTITFTIHKGHFIAVTNQTGNEAQEVNWTSYYRYISFRVDDAHPDLSLWRVFRRQDHEGPINDTWTELKWAVDEATGELILVEARKEWLTGHDGSSRTWYSVPWNSPSTEHALWAGPVSTNPDDRLSVLVTADAHGRDECGDEVSTRFEDNDTARPARCCHREYPVACAGESSTSSASTSTTITRTGETREYIRAKTKFSAYDFNRGCAVELVVDDVPSEGWRTKERLRLRVVSRLPIGLLATAPSGGDGTTCPVIQQRAARSGKNKVVDVAHSSEELFAPSEIHLWPREAQASALPTELAELMCPGGRTGEIKGMLGEEGLVYSVGPQGPNGERQLVFVCFDPAWGFEGLRRLDGSLAKPRRHSARDTSMSEAMDEEDRARLGGGSKRKLDVGENTDGTTDLPPSPNDHRPWSNSHAGTDANTNTATSTKRQRSTSPPDPNRVGEPRYWHDHTHSRHDSGIAMPSSDDEDHSDNQVDDTLSNDAGSQGTRTPRASPSQHGGGADAGSSASASMANSSLGPMLSSEPAMYLRLNRGFWVR